MFEEHCYRRVREALEALPAPTARDAYVVSFYLWEEEQDPRFPTIVLNVNTEQQVDDCVHERLEKPHPGWVPTDEAEARWNYAFWIQRGDVAVAASDEDPEGAALRQRWSEEIGTWVSDEELEADESSWERAAETWTHFWALAARVARRLHDDGVIARVFGRPIPVLLHELEYYEAIVEVNRRANPPELLTGFEAWIRGL